MNFSQKQKKEAVSFDKLPEATQENVNKVFMIGDGRGYSYEKTHLFEAIRKKDSMRVEDLLRLGADPNLPVVAGNTALHYASLFAGVNSGDLKKEYSRICAILIDNGADTELENDFGKSFANSVRAETLRIICDFLAVIRSYKLY